MFKELDKNTIRMILPDFVDLFLPLNVHYILNIIQYYTIILLLSLNFFSTRSSSKLIYFDPFSVGSFDYCKLGMLHSMFYIV